MKKVSRWTGWDMDEANDGAWVEYSDYAALAAENERLAASVSRLEKENALIQEASFAGAIVTKTIAAENERLRKAGDELLGNYYVALSDVSDFEQLPSVAQWLAAKEGRDAK